MEKATFVYENSIFFNRMKEKKILLKNVHLATPDTLYVNWHATIRTQLKLGINAHLLLSIASHVDWNISRWQF